MHLRTFLAIFLPFFLSACAGVNIPTAKLDGAGTYTAESMQRIDMLGSLTGKHTLLNGLKQDQQTTLINASLSTRFGISYKFAGTSSNQVVRHRVVWYFPEPGIRNPETNRIAKVQAWEQTCYLGKSCFAGRLFNETWELVPGTWVVEIWVGSDRQIRQSFELTVQ